MKRLLLFLTVAALARISSAQMSQDTKVPVITRVLRCGALIQPENGQVQHNVVVTIQGDRIKEVRESVSAAAGN